MLRRIRAAAVALALGAGALALVPAASASAGTAVPSISNVDISPGPPLDVTDKPVTATFRFATTSATKAELSVKAPGDVSVWTPIDLASTKNVGEIQWWGSKTFDAKSVGRWAFRAIARDDKGGEDITSGKFDVVVHKQLDTKIVDFDATPDLVNKGDVISTSGQLLIDKSGWKGYGGQSVTITFRAKGTDAYKHVAKTTTGANGWFSAKVKAEDTGWWRAEFFATSAAKGSVSDTDRVDIKADAASSRIVGFDAFPEPVDKGDQLNFKGALQVLGKSGWEGLSGQKVAILFKADGSSKWEYVTSDVTGAYGRFWASATAQTSGWWRAEFAGTAGVKGSSSIGDWVKVNQPPPPAEKGDSWVKKFNAYPEPVKYGRYLKFRATLLIDDGGSWEGYSAKVGLWFKPKGSHTWQYVKTTWSNDNGKLYTRVKAYKSGYWKFVFKGDSDFYGDHSRRDYVRVKH